MRFQAPPGSPLLRCPHEDTSESLESGSESSDGAHYAGRAVIGARGGWRQHSRKVCGALIFAVGLLALAALTVAASRKTSLGSVSELGVKAEESESDLEFADGDDSDDVDDGDDGDDDDGDSEGTTLTTTTRMPGLTFFCWTLVTVSKEDMSLVREVYERKLSIFACQEWAVYSDEKTLIGDDIYSIVIPDGEGATWGAVPGHPTWHMWRNTDVFARAWFALKNDVRYKEHEWTVKVDNDAVFFPDHLYYNLKWYVENKGLKPTDKVFFLNCWVYKSLQGPIEVLSLPATEAFLDGVDDCKSQIDYKEWGEDWFMDKCMEHLGIEGIQDWNMLSDFNCGETPAKLCKKNFKVAFHPFKTREEYFECIHSAELCATNWTVERCGGGVDDP